MWHVNMDEEKPDNLSLLDQTSAILIKYGKWLKDRSSYTHASARSVRLHARNGSTCEWRLNVATWWITNGNATSPNVWSV